MLRVRSKAKHNIFPLKYASLRNLLVTKLHKKLLLPSFLLATGLCRQLDLTDEFLLSLKLKIEVGWFIDLYGRKEPKEKFKKIQGTLLPKEPYCKIGGDKYEHISLSNSTINFNGTLWRLQHRPGPFIRASAN